MPRKPKPPEPQRKPERRTAGTGSVSFHPPSGLWRARPPKTIDPKQAPVYFPTRDEAVVWLDGELARIARRGTMDGSVSVGDYLGWWLETMALSASWPAGTCEKYAVELKYLTDLYDLELRALTRARVQGVVAGLQVSGLRKFRDPETGELAGRPLAARTICAAAGTWERSFAWAVEERWVAANPAARLVLPKVEIPPGAAWTTAEARRLAGALRDHRFEALIALVLGCGIRVGEGLALRWEDVDWTARTVRIRATGTRKVVQAHTKSRRIRVLTLPAPTWAALLRHREAQHAGAVYVFEREATRRRWHYWTARRDLKKLCAEIGIPEHAFHAGRHATATYLLASGATEADVAKLLGHASPAVTRAVYFHPTSEDATLAAMTADLFGSTESDPETDPKG